MLPETRGGRGEQGKRPRPGMANEAPPFPANLQRFMPEMACGPSFPEAMLRGGCFGSAESPNSAWRAQAFQDAFYPDAGGCSPFCSRTLFSLPRYYLPETNLRILLLKSMGGEFFEIQLLTAFGTQIASQANQLVSAIGAAEIERRNRLSFATPARPSQDAAAASFPLEVGFALLARARIAPALRHNY